MAEKTVLEVINDRMFARNSGLDFHDGYNLCLGVEGGAMRGIISAGMLIALADLNIIDIFDSYVGVSAGSLNLAYTLAGQAALGISLYFEDMHDKDIVNLLRFRSEIHPMMDLRKLYVHTTQNKKLDEDVLRAKYASSMKVAVTDVTDNRGELFSIQDAGNRFEEFLVAGALLPFIAGEPWIINNKEYFDGGLHYIDPCEAALEMGATHTFALNTRPQDKPLKPWGKLIEKKFKSLDEEYPLAGTHYIERIKSYCEIFDNKPYGETTLEDMKLYRHALIHDTGVGRLTMDTDKLIEGMKTGYKSISDLFHAPGHVGIMPTLAD